MKRLLIATAAAATLAASFGGAAAAQGYGYGQGGAYIPVSQKLDRIDNRIERGVRQGDLTRREATQLNRDVRALYQLEARYRYDGFSRRERQDLDARATALTQRVRYERRDPERPGYGYRR